MLGGITLWISADLTLGFGCGEGVRGASDVGGGSWFLAIPGGVAASPNGNIINTTSNVTRPTIRRAIVARTCRTNKVNETEALSLIEDVSSKEIKDALFDIGDNKSPGPNGFSYVFFKKAWNIIGEDFCKAVKEFFKSEKMLKDLNSTVISLIPKTQSPLKVTNYRPIACCNVVYKCISKVITRRLKRVRGNLVNINQSAFVAERQIQDNILLTQELLKGYDRKGGPSRVAFKIDIQKAYDTVNWCFLETILTHFGFPVKMIHWIMRNPKFQYHFGCKGMKLTHVCFADDLLVLCHGDAELVKVVRDTIEEFGKCSGLLPNFHKMYWCTVFLLPKTTIKDINSLLMGFLWCNGELSRGKAKINWKKICMPKSHGGLGLKDLEIWNKVLLISIDPNDSRGWKNLMEIRDEIRKHVWYKLGDGMTTSIRQIRTHDLNTEKKDWLVWKNKDEKEWKLMTWDKIAKWGSYDMNVCILCKENDKSHDHLFFKCNFSQTIWRKLKPLMQFKSNADKWNDIIEELTEKHNNDSIWSIVRRLCLAGAVYAIWRERINMIFRDEQCSWEVTLKMICEIVRLGLMGLNVKNSIAVQQVVIK
uniref:RNA-directed DNA polymerase, eukaryota, reverse transcriptase zinc-binding domain protein n=1 Tax=Tanacetum cinerariifolium TaxID=118510 RepID=A0A6L2M5G0_TANCI|nr:RNA-directed DNA polymerase, eukaryota, reverse transcriptase zinc-binding domain protein [Tanacetum cinerariifolium]